MQYVCLVYGEESMFDTFTPEQQRKLDADSMAHDRSLADAAKLIVAQALQTVKKSKSLRKRRGKVMVTDGPFAETKEQLLGFVTIEVDSEDEAIAIASAIPLAELGTVEVRAVYRVPGS